MADALASTAVETSKIEGEDLNPDAVRLSVARRLGLPGGSVQDDRTEGVVAMTLDATRNFDRPLTAERLFTWHADLFPIELGVEPTIDIGAWRGAALGPMRVVSGRLGKARIHFEAPAAEDVPAEMACFLKWFNGSLGKMNGLVRVAIAHLWFVTIHPFEDGNCRIARAIADMALAQDEATSERFYSVSAQIYAERKAYYEHLESAQRGDVDVTPYVVWMIECITSAVDSSREQVSRAMRAMRFWDKWQAFEFNERQRKVLLRYFGDFEGKLNMRKYLAISGAPRVTAYRDLSELVDAGILSPMCAARATSYDVVTY